MGREDMEEIKKMLQEHSKEFVDIKGELQDIKRDMKKMQGELQGELQDIKRDMKKLNYKIDDLEFKFKKHERSHELSKEENLDDLYEEPTPALGGIAGEISPTGRFMRW